MTIGRPLTKADLDNATGGIALSMFATMDNITKVKAVLDGFTAQNLVDNFGYSLTEANVLKSAFTDLADMVGVWTGSAIVGGARDHRAFAKSLLGTGLY